MAKPDIRVVGAPFVTYASSAASEGDPYVCDLLIQCLMGIIIRCSRYRTSDLVLQTWRYSYRSA